VRAQPRARVPSSGMYARGRSAKAAFKRSRTRLAPPRRAASRRDRRGSRRAR
jgi:hypothetical protein